MVVIMTGISFIFVFWFVILFSCLKVAARADRIMEAFLLGEEEYFGNQSEKNKSKKLDKAERERKRFDRELRDCMHCKFFWGNNHRCAMNKCCKTKQETVTEKKIPEKCVGCPYKQSNDYCFPCMKKILGK